MADQRCQECSSELHRAICDNCGRFSGIDEPKQPRWALIAIIVLAGTIAILSGIVN